MEFFGTPIEQALFIVLNLIIIEGLLSIDDAMIISGMLSHSEKKSRTKTILSVFVICILSRFLLLLFAAWLVNIWWLKILSGIALVYFGQTLFRKRKLALSYASLLLWLIILSLPQLEYQTFAAVAYTDNMVLIYFGVFVGVVMQVLLVKLYFVLQDRFPLLSAVIAGFMVFEGVLNISSVVLHFYPDSTLAEFLDSELFDLIKVLLISASIVVCIAIEYVRRQRTVV